jgi:hypothetical protein
VPEKLTLVQSLLREFSVGFKVKEKEFLGGAIWWEERFEGSK